jgi:hypothetical protein
VARPVIVHTRLTEEEAADLDSRRGSLNRAEWLRFLNARARKQGLRFGDIPPVREETQ